MGHRDKIDENRLEAFIDSVPGWAQLNEPEKIDWMVFFLIEGTHRNFVVSTDVEEAFRVAREPLTTYPFGYWQDELDKKYIRQNGGFSLTRDRIKELEQLLAPTVPDTDVPQEAKAILETTEPSSIDREESQPKKSSWWRYVVNWSKRSDARSRREIIGFVIFAALAAGVMSWLFG